MIRAWHRWVALISRTERGESLALFRLAVGLVVLYSVGTVVWHGLVPVLWMDQAYGGYRSIGESWWLVDALGGARPGPVWTLVTLTLCAGLALALGIQARLAALLAGQGFLALTWINGQAGGSYDDLIANACWLLVLGRSDATLSLSCRLRTGAWTSPVPVPAWPRWLVVGQLVVVYASTGVQKLSAYWTPGGDFSALYYILQQPTWQRIDMRWTAAWFPVTQVLTASVWFWEVTAPVLLLALYYRHTRTRPGRLRSAFNRLDFRLYWALFGIGMHLSIFAAMEVGPFTWISLAYYLCLWSPEEWRAAARGWIPGSTSRTGNTPLPVG